MMVVVPLLLETTAPRTPSPTAVATTSGAVIVPIAVVVAAVPPAVSTANELPVKHKATVAAIRIFFITISLNIFNALNYNNRIFYIAQ
jgi:hypothetical protein